MDHPAHLSTPQPWRAAALIAAAVAGVELCILLVLGVLLFGKFLGGQVDRATDPVEVAKAAIAREAGGSSSSAGGTSARKPPFDRGETSVIVLNGNGIAGAAATAAERVRARHYTIAATDNAPRSNVARSFVMYRPGFDREAKRLARDLGIMKVAPLDGMRASALQGAHLALILGAR